MYFHLWLPNSSLPAKPLYIASQGALEELLDPSKSIKSSFTKLKGALLRALALGILDYSRLSSDTYTQSKTSFWTSCYRIMATHLDLLHIYQNI
jgi:hypothetical protein